MKCHIYLGQVGSSHDKKSLVDFALIMLNTNLDPRKKLSEATDKRTCLSGNQKIQDFLPMDN